MVRRILFTVLASALILSFGACAKKEEAPETTTEMQAPADTAAAAVDTTAAEVPSGAQ